MRTKNPTPKKSLQQKTPIRSMAISKSLPVQLPALFRNFQLFSAAGGLFQFGSHVPVAWKELPVTAQDDV